MSLGLPEIILILIVALLLFGGKRIPELARALGKAQGEYQKAKETLENEVSEFKSEVAKAAKEETASKPAAKKTVSAKKTSAKKTAAKKAPTKNKKSTKTTAKSKA